MNSINLIVVLGTSLTTHPSYTKKKKKTTLNPLQFQFQSFDHNARIMRCRMNCVCPNDATPVSPLSLTSWFDGMEKKNNDAVNIVDVMQNGTLPYQFRSIPCPNAAPSITFNLSSKEEENKTGETKRVSASFVQRSNEQHIACM